MDNKYIKLFQEIVHSVEIIAEKVMELDKNAKDEKAEATAKMMRDDYARLYDQMRAEDFDINTLTKSEFAKILVGTMIVSSNLEEQITKEQSVLKGYKINIIPKLDRIINEAKNDEEALKLANELFVISENE